MDLAVGKANAKKGKITTQCLPSSHLGNSYKCPKEASEKCKFVWNHFSQDGPVLVPIPSTGLPKCPSGLALGSGHEPNVDPNGQCNGVHKGACYNPDLLGINGGKITTQCLPKSHLGDSYKCPTEASKKCEFESDHFSLAEIEEDLEDEASLPDCPSGLALGSGHEPNVDPNGQCNGVHKGACYDPDLLGINGGKITTQCLPKSHLGDSYKCPTEASKKCEFESDHFSLAEVEEDSESSLPNCPAKLAWGSGLEP